MAMCSTWAKSICRPIRRMRSAANVWPDCGASWIVRQKTRTSNRPRAFRTKSAIGRRQFESTGAREHGSTSMMDVNALADFGLGWLEASGAHSDIVLSTRVRLARNLQGHAFSPKLRDAERV